MQDLPNVPVPEEVEGVDWIMWAKRIGVSLAIVAFAFAALNAISGTADAQTQRVEIMLVGLDERAVEGESLGTYAGAFEGDGDSVEFEGRPRLSMWVTSADQTSSTDDPVIYCWNAVSWVEHDAIDVQMPPGCFFEPDQSLGGQHAYSWDVETPPPCTATACDASQDLRNMTLRVNGTLPSNIQVGNAVTSSRTDVQIVDSKDQLFGHQAAPFEVDDFNQNQTLFILIAMGGLILAAIKGWVWPALAALMGLGRPIFQNAGVEFPVDFTFTVLLYAIGIAFHMALARFGSQHEGEGGLVR